MSDDDKQLIVQNFSLVELIDWRIATIPVLTWQTLAQSIMPQANRWKLPPFYDRNHVDNHGKRKGWNVVAMTFHELEHQQMDML